MNKFEYLETIKQNRKQTLPLFTYPVAKHLRIPVDILLKNSNKQIEVMHFIENNFPTSFCLTPMDLTLEAEHFGVDINYYSNQLPEIGNPVLNSLADIDNLTIPSLDHGRIVETFKTLKNVKSNIPVIASITGPLTLATLLIGFEKMLEYLAIYPRKIDLLLQKVTKFIKQYVKELKFSGANGLMISEPLSTELSFLQAKVLSTKYINEIINEVTDENFYIIYHNCGNVLNVRESIKSIHADIYHFGNLVDIEETLRYLTIDKIVMGNIDPVAVIQNGDSKLIVEKTEQLLYQLSNFPNYVISTGCDLPLNTKIDNLKTYCNTVIKFYE